MIKPRGRRADNNLTTENMMSPHMTTIAGDEESSPRHDSRQSLNDSMVSDTSNASSVDFEEMLKTQHIVYIQNQYKGQHLIPLVSDCLSDSDGDEEEELKKVEGDSIATAQIEFKSICRMIEKVSADAELLSRKLRGLKEHNYDTTISWTNDEYLHKIANLKNEESQREMILLKKKKLERIRRDALNVRNLENEEDPELFLQIKYIEFRESREVIKTFFASIDLIVYKNSTFSFDWSKFIARVFRNKETIDAYLYRMKYFSFNDMTDYHMELCRKFTEEEQDFLALFDDSNDKKVPFEIYIIKPFVEWMRVMKYGYELNQQLIKSIKLINTASNEVDKLRINMDILKKRLEYSNELRVKLQKHVDFLSLQLENAKSIKQEYKKQYNFE